MANETRTALLGMNECANIAVMVFEGQKRDWEAASNQEKFDAIRAARSVLRSIAVDGADVANLTAAERVYAQEWFDFVSRGGGSFGKQLQPSGVYEPVAVLPAEPLVVENGPAVADKEAPKGKKK